MKLISRTLKDENRNPHYEFVTTRGLSKKSVVCASFVSYYMVSHIPRSVPEPGDRVRYWKRNSDMARLTGLQVKVEMIVKPKSGFRVRLLLIQTPFDMADMTSESDTENNQARIGTRNDPQGSFASSLQYMSSVLEETDENGVTSLTASVSNRFSGLFDRQLKDQTDTSFHDELMTMRVTHPNTVVLSDSRMFVRNRKNVTRTFKWKKFRPLRTTVRYPPVYHADQSEQGEYNRVTFEEYPDRKIYAFFIITPAKEQYEIPDTGYKNAVMPEPADERGMARTVRFGSVDPEQIHPLPDPLAGPAGGSGGDLDPVEEAEEYAEDGGVGDGSGRQTRSQTGQIDYSRMGAAVATALLVNREKAKKEREEEKRKQREEKEARADHLFTNMWAEDQGMLFKPTFNLWFKDMPKSMTSLVVRQPTKGYRYGRRR